MREEYQELVRPSGQCFSLDTALAAAYGMKEAFLIQHFQHWIRLNKTRKQSFRDGRTWTYQTYNEIATHFPFLTYKQVRTGIDNLVEYGVLIKANYNQMPGDNTLWFAFSDESIYVPDIKSNKVKDDSPQKNYTKESDDNPLPKRSDPPSPISQTPVQKGSAIPDTKPDTKLYNKTTNPTLPSNGSVGGLSKESKKIDIYQCLRGIDIQDKDKIRITSQFDEMTVSKAVAHCTKPSFKVQTSLDSSIFYFCKNPSHIKAPKEEIQAQKLKEEDEKRDREENRRQAGSAVMKYFWTKCRELGVFIREQQDYLQISNDRISEKLYYADHQFGNLLSHLLIKVGLESPKFLESL